MAAPAAFTEADIRRIAGTRSFERGLGYLHEVENLEISSSQVTATVYGGSKYRVLLAFGEGELSGDCSCPHGRDGFFCKHCVAVALAVLRMGEDLPRRIEVARAGKQRFEAWLESLSKEELLAELLGLLNEDPDLRRSFELRAASVNVDAAAVRSAVRQLLELPPRGYVEYDQAHEYANGVLRAARAIDELTSAGGAEDAIGIAREALALLTVAYESVDDSSGAVTDAAYALLAAHLNACEAAPPEPVSLGAYLAGLLLHDEYGFAPALEDYADLLGDSGTAVARERIAAEYAAQPGNWHAKSLMESVLRAEGDADAIVAFLAADLDDRGWNHLRIAEELGGAGRDAEALAWAERGVREAARPDERLVEHLADRYRSAGRDDDVLSLRRARFSAERTLANYQLLRDAAGKTGAWPAERASALQLLRADARNLPPRAAWAWNGPVLVDVLIDDGDLDAAWAAAEGAATTEQWLRLARASIDTRPADALPVYLRAIEPLKQQTGDAVYQRIASHLLAARACHQALGTAAEFTRYLAALRVDQKRKRNLMKILDKNGL
ncbi:MAG: SWIM zinc finger family protein [Streptosporangiaceae bacterium]|nr:SWIM zinc finger family protein [Streptosporangiaceae bacterium]MBV9855399.1 SWIM zinc finger family protein [Streptosporangiaceae bacterium]